MNPTSSLSPQVSPRSDDRSSGCLRANRWWRRFLVALLALASASAASAYTNLSVAVYFRYQEVHSIPSNLAQFSNQWANVEKQLKVDKVYLETTRNAELATEADVTTLKKFFTDRGIKASGGMGLTTNEPRGFRLTATGRRPIATR